MQLLYHRTALEEKNVTKGKTGMEVVYMDMGAKECEPYGRIENSKTSGIIANGVDAEDTPGGGTLTFGSLCGRTGLWEERERGRGQSVDSPPEGKPTYGKKGLDRK